MEDVENKLQASGDKERRAHFVAALSLCWPDGHCESFEGKVVRPPDLAAARRSRLRL